MSDLSKELDTFVDRIGSGDNPELNQASEYLIDGKCAHHHEPTFHLFNGIFEVWRDTPLRRTFYHLNGGELPGDSLALKFLSLFPKLVEDTQPLLARSYAMGLVVNGNPEHEMCKETDEKDDKEADNAWYIKATQDNDFTAEVEARWAEVASDTDAMSRIVHYFKRTSASSVGNLASAAVFGSNSDDLSSARGIGDEELVWAVAHHSLWVTGLTLYLAGAEAGKHQAFLKTVGQ